MKKTFINNLFFLNWNIFNLIYVILKNIIIYKFLMTAFINYNSLIKIIFKWFVNYYSRSKNFFWFKGVKSKNFQIFKKIYIDCDMDIVTIFILQNYNLCCHTNYIYCDFNKLNII